MTPNVREEAILALLAKGHTDAEVAADLGISVRTVAYAVSALMERHGVGNRFQLGLALGAQGGIVSNGSDPDGRPDAGGGRIAGLGRKTEEG